MRTISEIHHPNCQVRTLFLVFSLIYITNVSFGQKIETGKYLSVWKYNHFTGETVYNGEYHEEITIIDSVNFIYKLNTDLENYLGFGKYELKKKFLDLEFTEIPLNYDTSKFKIKDSAISKDDSITLRVFAYYKKVPLEGAWIEYFSNNTKISKFDSDNNGFVIVKISKKDLPGYIYLRYVGLGNYRVNIMNDYNKEIIIDMDVNYEIISKGKAITYSVKEIDLDGFYIKGGIFPKWTFFKREE